jgi:hypothetical protein
LDSFVIIVVNISVIYCKVIFLWGNFHVEISIFFVGFICNYYCKYVCNLLCSDFPRGELQCFFVGLIRNYCCKYLGNL